MTTPRFLQVHTLHSYPAALLNRDDSGLAKRMPFGGAGSYPHIVPMSEEALAYGPGRVCHPQHLRGGRGGAVPERHRAQGDRAAAPA